jgi:hypothetical protein
MKMPEKGPSKVASLILIWDQQFKYKRMALQDTGIVVKPKIL